MIHLDSSEKDKGLERKFYFAIYSFLFLAGLYSGMYCYRFGVIVDVKHNVQAAIYSPKDYFSYLTAKVNNDFDDVSLTIKFKDYIKISNQRSRFVYSKEHFFKGIQWKNRVDDYVKSTLKFNNQKYKVKAKLFGKNNDHFRHPFKWSFRVKTKDYIHAFGNGKFNLLQPNTRQYLTDLLCNQVFKKHDILSLNYRPINLSINNKPKDIYFIEDFFSKYLIEKNEHRDSFIFTFEKVKHPSKKKLTNEMIADIDSIKHDIISGSDTIINEKKFNTFFALLFIAQNKHPFFQDNFHMFYNSVSNSVEPMIREVWFEAPLKLNSSDDLQKKIRSFLSFLIPYNKNLKTYLESQINNKEKLDKIYNDVLVVAKDIKEITNTKEWLTLEKNIYARFPQAIHLCKNIKINTNAVLKYADEERINIIKENTKKILASSMKLEGDLVLNNQDLIISSGVTLDMNGYNIILNSGKLEAISRINSKITIFNSENKRGSSIIVKQARDTSKLKNVVIKNLSNYNNSYWHLPSAITFYESNVIIENALLEDNRAGDDFINFFRCDYFNLDHVEFKNVISDAIDSDFSTGTLTNSHFYNVGNDAIDGSGSILRISNSVFNTIEDKVISAGEKSFITVENSIIENSEISFVSKDDSTLKEQNNTLAGNNLNYCVFNKKEEFKNGILISDKNISNYSHLIEKRSKIYKGDKLLINLKVVDSVKERLYGKQYGKKSIKK